MSAKTKAITVQNSFTDTLEVEGGRAFNVSIWGTFVATVTIQRSFDAGSTWLDVANYVAPGEDTGSDPEGCLYRVGVKTGGYTSGTVNVRIGQ